MFRRADPEIIDRLLLAIESVDIAEVKEILQEAKAKNIDLNVHTKKFVTPLHWAVLKCHEDTQKEMIDVIGVLKEFGIDVNKGSNDSKNYFPIHTASRRGLPQIVQWLIENGANPQQQDKEGKTPLDFVSSAIKAKVSSKGSEEEKETAKDVIDRLSAVSEILSNPPRPKTDPWCNLI